MEYGILMNKENILPDNVPFSTEKIKLGQTFMQKLPWTTRKKKS